MADFQQHLSSALRQLRQANGWSLTLTAERTGVSKAMLGQIERGESSPTVATLWKIATGFNVPFSFLSTAAYCLQAPRLHSVSPMPTCRYGHCCLTIRNCV